MTDTDFIALGKTVYEGRRVSAQRMGVVDGLRMAVVRSVGDKKFVRIDTGAKSHRTAHLDRAQRRLATQQGIVARLRHKQKWLHTHIENLAKFVGVS